MEPRSFSSNNTRSLLIVDDEPTILSLCGELVSDCGLDPRTALTTEQALRTLSSERINGLITDIRVPAIGGMDLIRRVRQDFPAVDIFVLTQYGTISTAKEAIRLGALDYVEKPFTPDHFTAMIRSWLQCPQFDLRERVDRLGLVGDSPQMQRVKAATAKLSQTNSTVLILGETGTGKGIVARSIHRLGPRADHPFVPVDCAALAASLIESELFGYARGAFTGAVREQKGLFEAANKGTVFLDEIGDLPIGLQAKLLRVIEDREVRRLGSTSATPLDVRIIAATNRDLKKAVSDGTFRHDLYYRLGVVEMTLPPLRDRRIDIPFLVQNFLKKHADPGRPITRIATDFFDQLMFSEWPGNVRQLENLIENSIALGFGPELRDERRFMLLGRTGKAILRPDNDPLMDLVRPCTLKHLERIAIRQALARNNGDRNAAASELGIDRTTLHRKLKSYGESFV
jgi:DNA-binding NtrC family response regulator